jgi:hypothetical protein
MSAASSKKSVMGTEGGTAQDLGGKRHLAPRGNPLENLAEMSTMGVGGAAQRRMLGGMIAIAGGLLLVLGAFLPWVKVTAALVGSLAVSGIEGDGIFFLVGGVLIAERTVYKCPSRANTAPDLHLWTQGDSNP